MIRLVHNMVLLSAYFQYVLFMRTEVGLSCRITDHLVQQQVITVECACDSRRNGQE